MPDFFSVVIVLEISCYIKCSISSFYHWWWNQDGHLHEIDIFKYTKTEKYPYSYINSARFKKCVILHFYIKAIG